MPKPRTITARATVNLSGLPAGATAKVDPAHPQVAALLRTGLLVNEDAPAEEAPPAAEQSVTTRGGRGSENPPEKTTTENDRVVAPPPRRGRASSTATESSPN